MRILERIKTGAELAESPYWDASKKLLTFVDISKGRLYQCGASGENMRAREAGGLVGMVAPAASGKLLAAVDQSLRFFTSDLAPADYLARDIGGGRDGIRLNDGKCDALGRLWIGEMHKSSLPAQAKLYRITGDGETRTALTGLTISNGIGFSPDNRFMYHADTPSGRLMRYEFDLASGSISGGKTLVDYSGDDGDIDGLCVDCQGTIWACHWGGFQVCQYDPISGEKLCRARIPVPNPTSCRFGDGGILYVTTGVGRDKSVAKDYPDSGSIFILETHSRGSRVYCFDDRLKSFEGL